MKTIFGLFERYHDAEVAIHALVEDGFDEEQMNVIVREDVAKQNLDVDLHEVYVQKSDEVGEKTVYGMTELLGGEQSVLLPDVGRVLAGGQLATLLSSSASSSSDSVTNLTAALEEFGVTNDVAKAFQDGLIEGGVLFWIRVDDEQTSIASNTLRSRNGKYVANYS